MSTQPLSGGLSGAMFATFGAMNAVPTSPILSSGTVRQYPQALYSLNRALAANTNAYKSLLDVLGDYGLEDTAMQGLRNPVNAVCEFYESTLWPGTIREDDDDSALPLIVGPDARDADNLRAAIHQVWRWSNWNDGKETAAYDAANLGDQVFKVRSDEAQKRAWFEVIAPDYMTDLDTDGRGYLTYIRLDIPVNRRKADGAIETVIHTEVWDKETQLYRRWEGPSRGIVSLDQLGRPTEQETMEQLAGVDFVPFVHWRFKATSTDSRGVSAFGRALDKIIYGDALVTALHQRLTRYNQADWALEGSGVDADGMPIPAPQVGSGDDGAVLEMGGGKLWRLPSGWKLRDLVAGLDYANHLAVVDAHYRAMKSYDLQELTWYEVSEASGADSGRALDYKLTPAKSKLDKARGRSDASLIRVTQMCLSVGQQLGIADFSEAKIGTYAAGNFDFWIADRPIVPVSPQDQIDMDAKRATTAQTLAQTYGADGAAEVAGYSEDQRAALADFTNTPAP